MMPLFKKVGCLIRDHGKSQTQWPGFQRVGQDFLKDTEREKWVEYNCLPDHGLEKRYIKMNNYSSCPQGVFNLVDF